MEDSLIIEAINRNEEAFNKLASQAVPQVKALLVNHFHLQPSDIDDIVQLALVSAWNSINTFRRESSFTTWFYTIAKNKAYAFLKAQNRLEQKELHIQNVIVDGEEVEELNIEQIFEQTAATLCEYQEMLEVYRDTINEALNKLPEPHRQVIQMALEEEKSYRNIAEELDIPIGTVMSRLFFARKRAQDIIIKYARRNNIQLTCLG